MWMRCAIYWTSATGDLLTWSPCPVNTVLCRLLYIACLLWPRVDGPGDGTMEPTIIIHSLILNPVHTIQPVVKPVEQPVECLFTRCSRLFNRFDKWLCRVNEDLICQMLCHDDRDNEPSFFCYLHIFTSFRQRYWYKYINKTKKRISVSQHLTTVKAC